MPKKDNGGNSGGTTDLTLQNTAASETHEGGKGTDTVVYGEALDYLTLNDNGDYELNLTHIRRQQYSLSSEDGTETDTLNNIEQILFENGQSDLYDEFTYIIGQNNAVMTGRDTGTVDEDSSVTVNVLANDYDLDGDSFSLVSAQTNVAGAVTFDAAGNVTFDASGAYDSLAEGETAEVVVTYVVADAHGLESTSTLTLTVTGTNDAPVVTQQMVSIQVLEDTVFTGQVVATDADGDALTYQVTGTTPDGLTFNADGSYTFDANHATYQGLNGGDVIPVTFSWVAVDAHGAVSNEQQVEIVVTGTYDPPVAQPTATFTLSEDSATWTGKVEATSADPNLVYQSVGVLPEGFTLQLDGTFTFDPSPEIYQSLKDGEVMTLGFQWEAVDSQQLSTGAQLVNFYVTGTNDAPVITYPDSTTQYSVMEDEPAFIGQIGARDVDLGDNQVLSYKLTGDVPVGLTLHPEGWYELDLTHDVYQSVALGDYMPVQFSVIAVDEHGAESDPALITVVVEGNNDAPVATTTDYFNVVEGSIHHGQVVATDIDVEPNGGGLTYSVTSSLPDGMTFNSDGTYTIDASSGYEFLLEGQIQPWSFTWIATDSYGETTAEETVYFGFYGLGDQNGTDPILTMDIYMPLYGNYYQAVDGTEETFHIMHNSTSDTDQIFGFNESEDVLNFSDIMSGDLSAGLTIDELLTVESDGVDTTVSYDAGADGTTDHTVLLYGTDLVQGNPDALANLIGSGVIEDTV